MINDYDKSIHRHTIELLDVQTGELHRYAERQASGWVAWLPQQQALAYSDFEYLNQQSQGKYREDLWISWGSPQQAQRVATGADSDSLAIDPTGHVTYFPREGGGQPLGLQLQQVDVTTLAKQVPSLDLAQWDLSDSSRAKQDFKPADRRLQSTWRPGQASQVLLSLTGAGMLLADTQTGEICRISIRQQDKPLSGSVATWSPGGQHLAMLVRPTVSEGETRRHLAVFDMNTGQMSFPDLGTGDLLDIAWGPDSQHLVALMKVVLSNAAGDIKYELYMIDVPTQTARQILPEARVGGGTGGWGEMSWSPDGRYLAINCPIRSPGHPIIEQRICLITTSKVP